MLKIKNISKIYETGDFRQVALNDISVDFRNNEFVSILGPSGSGKTTLLNILGGLDHYDSGDLIINGISTKNFKDRDWDTYRNHKVGFVFQNYNLIAHQSILSNVELALTLSGISKKKRRARAKEMLEKVGLINHIYKRPAELSGGQMQRVAIARALINNPDIILADEPTGALDSKTSLQIMELLNDVAKDRLVIMVTHNQELAEEYSNRIIRIQDGVILNDTNPYKEEVETISKKDKNKTSMSILTSLSLSLNNLMTKKGRTFLTSFAGSIGIIGIALILSISNGVQEYINDSEKSTFASLPIMIERETLDTMSIIQNEMENTMSDSKCEDGMVCTYNDANKMSTEKIHNNTVKLKEAIDDNYKNIKSNASEVRYNYNITPIFYNPDTATPASFLNISSNYETIYNNFTYELGDNKTNLNKNFEILDGRFPENYDELVIITNKNGTISSSLAYGLNLIERNEQKKDFESVNFKFKEIVGKELKLVLNSSFYVKEDGYWVSKQNNSNYVKKIVSDGLPLKIVGIIKPKENATFSDYIGHTKSLTRYVMTRNNDSEIVKEQRRDEKINVFTNMPFQSDYESIDSNYSVLGSADEKNPASIYIYPKGYNEKDSINEALEEYNKKANKKDKIFFVDNAEIILKSITSIINIITYVLVAFVAISLVVSSIMIAIITYISVLERTKEIGILRAIGASKKDISRVFKSETIIEGIFSGVLGVFITMILCIPINKIIFNLTKAQLNINLPIKSALILICISVLLTLIAGLIPSRIASKKDPVESLRSE